MAYKSYPFAGAGIKIKETRLIKKERLLRIMEAKTAEVAYRAFMETGYGSGESAGASYFEQLIKREMKNTYDYLFRVVPDINAFSLFLLKNDYLNLKILMKLSVKKEPLLGAALKDNGTIPADDLKSAVEDKKYDSLPAEMKEALVVIDKQFSVKEDVSIIGLYLDAAYAKHSMRAAKSIKHSFIMDYMKAYADITNVISFMRLRLLEFGKEVFKKVYIKGGSYDEKLFFDIYEAGLDSVSHFFARREYEKPLLPAFEGFKRTGSLYMLEKARDEYLISIINKRKNDVFTIAPAIAYMLEKEREADNVRLIMTAKLNGKDIEFISDRIKEDV